MADGCRSTSFTPGYRNQIFWSIDSFATRHALGVDDQTASVDLGVLTAGKRIEFGIQNDPGQFFRTGPASGNADGIEHAQFTTSAAGVQIGFEDLTGGGDRDFNDAIIRVRASSPETVTAAAVSGTNGNGSGTAPDTARANNRSGLGDGTNPGQGAGRTLAPNTGTLNPAQNNTAVRLPVAQALPATKAAATKAASSTPSAASVPASRTAGAAAAPSSAATHVPASVAKASLAKSGTASSAAPTSTAALASKRTSASAATATASNNPALERNQQVLALLTAAAERAKASARSPANSRIR